ncbi:MAG: hypothetical protein WHU10_03790 [Fimbriimonadales bacterium]
MPFSDDYDLGWNLECSVDRDGDVHLYGTVTRRKFSWDEDLDVTPWDLAMHAVEHWGYGPKAPEVKVPHVENPNEFREWTDESYAADEAIFEFEQDVYVYDAVLERGWVRIPDSREYQDYTVRVDTAGVRTVLCREWAVVVRRNAPARLVVEGDEAPQPKASPVTGGSEPVATAEWLGFTPEQVAEIERAVGWEEVTVDERWSFKDLGEYRVFRRAWPPRVAADDPKEAESLAKALGEKGIDVFVPHTEECGNITVKRISRRVFEELSRGVRVGDLSDDARRFLAEAVYEDELSAESVLSWNEDDVVQIWGEVLHDDLDSYLARVAQDILGTADGTIEVLTEEFGSDMWAYGDAYESYCADMGLDLAWDPDYKTEVLFDKVVPKERVLGIVLHDKWFERNLPEWYSECYEQLDSFQRCILALVKKRKKLEEAVRESLRKAIPEDLQRFRDRFGDSYGHLLPEAEQAQGA